MPQPINLSTTAIYIEAFFYSIFPKLYNTGFTAADIRSSHWRCSIKKTGLGNFEICKEKHLSQSCRPAAFSKKTSAQIFSYEYCLIFKNTYFGKYLNGFRIFSVVKCRNQALIQQRKITNLNKIWICLHSSKSFQRMKFSNQNTIIKVASWFTSSNIYIN